MRNRGDDPNERRVIRKCDEIRKTHLDTVQPDRIYFLHLTRHLLLNPDADWSACIDTVPEGLQPRFLGYLRRVAVAHDFGFHPFDDLPGDNKNKVDIRANDLLMPRFAALVSLLEKRRDLGLDGVATFPPDPELKVLREIAKLARGSGQDVYVHGEVPEKTIVDAETSLGVKFPPSYRTYLRYLGAAEILGYAFDGLPDNTSYVDEAPFYTDVVSQTQSFREHIKYFTDQMVYLTDDGGPVFYCLDTSVVSLEGESPALAFFFGKKLKIADSFIELVSLLADPPRLHDIINGKVAERPPEP